ncbi:MAG: aminopeptidase P N-terminal domain-containing protein, partial [Candidatus Acidiferrales bacterium]
LAPFVPRALAWEREPNAVFAERRAKLMEAINSPIVLFGYTGHEDSNPSYVFMQEENFYYLTGHNEEGAALLLVPDSAAQVGWKGAREILYLPQRDPAEERWNGPRMGPDDPGIQEKTGFADVEPFGKLHDALETLAKNYHEIYTELPHPHEDGYPHAADESKWVADAAPQATLRDVTHSVDTLREIKSPGELDLIQKAIDASIDAHLAAMQLMHPGLFEYQVAAKMVEIHDYAGCETEAYAPIVGSGFNSTILHYNKLDRRIEDGDIVLMDVGGQYSGYAADITRTIPANGKYSPRQREIYDIVLGAQNAALAALKPGMTLGGPPETSLQKIAMDYINSHGKDQEGRSLGRYYIHGLSHDLGLDVHDPTESFHPLQAGMVITVEPGIYIPEENLGVRIEDDVLITPTGYTLLTARLPRDPDVIEKIMAEGKAERAKKPK